MALKPIEVVPIEPPPVGQRVRRDARFAAQGARRTRYTLPDALKSASPVGYRTRIGLSQAQAEEALQLLSMERPSFSLAVVSLVMVLVCLCCLSS